MTWCRPQSLEMNVALRPCTDLQTVLRFPPLCTAVLFRVQDRPLSRGAFGGPVHPVSRGDASSVPVPVIAGGVRWHHGMETVARVGAGVMSRRSAAGRGQEESERCAAQV